MPIWGASPADGWARIENLVSGRSGLNWICFCTTGQRHCAAPRIEAPLQAPWVANMAPAKGLASLEHTLLEIGTPKYNWGNTEGLKFA